LIAKEARGEKKKRGGTKDRPYRKVGKKEDGK
jgi:hypothetical protein